MQTLTVGVSNGSSTFSGIYQYTTGSLGLIKTGSGTHSLTGKNTYSGDTVVEEGSHDAASRDHCVTKLRAMTLQINHTILRNSRDG